ncbi:MAG: hypothetical protein ABSB15_29200 [Bryobacteraceae bacterium]|jgi:hypothetical protein
MKTNTMIPDKKPGVIDPRDLAVTTDTLTPELLHKMDAYWARRQLFVSRPEYRRPDEAAVQ